MLRNIFFILSVSLCNITKSRCYIYVSAAEQFISQMTFLEVSQSFVWKLVDLFDCKWICHKKKRVNVVFRQLTRKFPVMPTASPRYDIRKFFSVIVVIQQILNS